VDTLFEADAGGRERGARDAAIAASRLPLAARMRPAALADFIGQEQLLRPGSTLRTAIEQGRPHSMILYGPPGTGKTTLARIIAASSGAAFEEHSAVDAGRAEVRGVMQRARHRRAVDGTPTVFFLDEIHRFNKAQQDALLPAVEEGLVTLIGATTENPAFEVNSALLSRTRVYALAPLDAHELQRILRRAVALGEHGAWPVDDDALDFLATHSAGDARVALSALELASATAGEQGAQRITLALAADALQRRTVLYDRAGDRHYDYISAWIKATRGSDPDASLYYLAVMLEGGEDPRLIARRMVILASEDIGNADPAALGVAVAAAHAVERVGLPEARYALAQAAIYLSLAPKSNAAGAALGAAVAHVREHGAAPVPGWLRSGPRPGQNVGGYDNPHSHPGHVAGQELLPQSVAGACFYTPDEAERQLAERLAAVRRARGLLAGDDERAR
jgi:putative ATPase